MFLFLHNTGDAASVDTVGREFVFAYPTPYYPTSSYTSYLPVLYLVIQNQGVDEGTTTVKIINGERLTVLGTENVGVGALVNITIPFRSYFGNDFTRNIEDPKTIKITATIDVSVHAFYSYNQRYSTWLIAGTVILPTSALGTKYFVASYQPTIGYYSEFTVTSLDEATNVEVRGRDGFRQELALEPHQTFQYRSKIDLTGSEITADKPISVVSGVSASKVPINKDYNSYLVSHLPAADGLGRNYLLAPFKDRSSGYIYRVVGTKDNTNMIISGSTHPIELHAGEMLDRDLPGDNITSIEATQPILVYQLSKGYAMENSIGNAAMVVVPGIDMFSSGVMFPVTVMPTASDRISYSLSITIRCEASQGLLLDGVALGEYRTMKHV